MSTQRVLSGIRATGRLHLGNYLGAVQGMLALQENKLLETFFMVADIHTITTPYTVSELREHRRQVIIDYLAAGLDPERSVLFLQSMVPEHTELAFYFSSVMSIARMQHLPTFKDKVKQYPEHATMALLNYPILMSADILVYKADLVPVGIDQEPHLEVAREVARKMNETYGTEFPEPVRFATDGEYIPSLKGVGKMSKSVEGSYITLSDSEEEILSRLAGTPTDSGKGSIARDTQSSKKHEQVTYTDASGAASVGVANLLTFVEYFQGLERRTAYETQYETTGIRYGDLKKELAAAIYQELKPFQERRAKLLSDTAYVDDVITEGARKARVVAAQTVAEVRTKMGLG